MAVAKPIHHIGVVVRSLDESHAFFRDKLGLPLLKEQYIEEQGVRASLLDLGNALLELLEPVEPETGIARYLDRYGGGLHHVCFEVDGIEQALAGLKKKGVPLVDETPRAGLTGTIAFLHPSALHGVLVELVDARSAFVASGALNRPIIQRLDHLVLAVQEIEPAARAWADALGLQAKPPVQPAGTHMELAFLPAGDAFLELVRPTSDTHRVARHIAERGEGMFSLSLVVDDLDAAVADLRARNVEVSDPEAGVLPHTRARPEQRRRVARIPRASAHGVAVQLIERSRQ